MLAADVVVSEIMYNPSSRNPLDEFIELHNRGDEAADLNAWQVSDGVAFTFGATSLAAGDYLVVAADLAKFQANYPGVTNVVGGWTGELSNTGERVEISDALGATIDRVTYADEGDWALRLRGPVDRNHQGWVWFADHDGLGKSIEVVNLLQGNNNGQNWLPSVSAGGTPGAANSVAATDIAPIISDAIHTPAIPRSTDAVTIRAEIDDELASGATAEVFWRVDGDVSFTATAMVDDGTSGDLTAGDGVFAATLPAQPHGTVVEFYLRAADAASNVRTWPGPTDTSGTQGANLLYQVDNGFFAGEEPIYRLIMTEAERFELESMGNDGFERSSNAQMNATFISMIGDDVEVRYNVGQRLRGASSRGFNVKSYRLNIPSDRDWQGVTAINLNARSVYSQVAGSAIFAAAGLPAAEATLAQVRVNGSDLSSGGGYAHLEVTNGDFVGNHFGDDSDGNLYNKRRPDNKWAFRNGNVQQYLNDGWDKDTNSSINDWTDLDDFLNVINNAPEFTYVETISPHVNIDQWLRWFATMTLMDSNETNPSIGTDDDYAMYRGIDDPRFVLIPHDLDSVLGNQGSSTTADLFRMLTDAGGLPQLVDFFSHPDIAWRYYAQLRELATTVFSSERFDPLLQNLLGGKAPQATIDAMQQFMAARIPFVLSQIPSEVTISSALPNSNGFLRTTSATTTLTGFAPVEGTKQVLVGGTAVSYNPRTGAWTSGLPQLASENILPALSTWKYNDQGIDLGTAWRESAFNDAAWPSGPGQLGFGDGDEGTTINCGASAPACDSGNILTYYFRHTINLPEPSRYTGLVFRVLRDDGVAIYLNGVEVVRDNLAPGATFSDSAETFVNGAAENQYFEFFVPSTSLVAGANVLAAEVHQNGPNSSDISFDLAVEGLLTDVTPATFITAGSAWKYLDNGVDQGTAWRQPTFNDAAWLTGNAQLGYGDGDETTVINCGPSQNCRSNNIPTYYFRKTFEVANAAQVATLRLRLLRDDGAAVYINGVEVARDNLPTNATFDTFAPSTIGGGGESTFFEFDLNSASLVSGTNTIAVEIHQQSATSSDVSFDLELVGTVSPTSIDENVPLLPGINRVLVQALGDNGVEVDRRTIDIWYDDATAPVYSGTISANTTWTAQNGPHRVSGELVVAAGATLTVEAGATVFFNPGSSLTVHGRLEAVGTDTRRIRLGGLPTAAGNWSGMLFDGPTALNRLSFVDIDGAANGDSIVVAGSSLEVANATFGPTNFSVIAFEDSSILVRDSVFPNVGAQVQISGEGLPTGKRVSIEGNTFPSRITQSPTIEFRSAQRPGPVFQVRDNVFEGGPLSPAALVLAGADAYVEGNYFRGFRINGAAAIIARGDGGLATHLTLGRNTISGNSIGVVLLDGSRLVSQSNTFADNTSAAISFGDVASQTPGAAATLSGDIAWGNGQTISGAVVNDPTHGTTEIAVDFSLVPADAAALGTGNITADPRFADTSTYALRSSSPAIGAGPQGQNIGASAPKGAVVGNEPQGITTSNGATLTVGGAGVVSYFSRIDNGSLRSEVPVSQPFVLSGLSDGPHSVQIIPRDAAGVLQGFSTPANSDTWIVDSTLSRVQISEVLAINRATTTVAGFTPDFIELHNDGVAAIDLSGMFLSDDPGIPTKYIFAEGTTIAVGEYLVLYADVAGALSSAEIQLPFALDGAGDGVYLYAPDLTIVDQVTFGMQIADLSVARMAGGEWSLAQPTPGAGYARAATGDASLVVINEWLATADRLLGDDFVELYNRDSLPVSLGGLAITDNFYAAPRKHEFAPLSFIPAGGYGVFTADGNASARADHLSFRLSAWREALMLVDEGNRPIDVVLFGPQSTDVSQGRSPDAGSTYRLFTAPSPGLANADVPVLSQPILAVDSIWRYEDTGTNLGTEWREAGYNDTFWATGAGILFVENADLPGPKNTPLNLGSTTFYYRTEFDADAISDGVDLLQLSLLVDDGAVVYLNGQEIVRLGMPGGTITHNTFASRHVGAAAFEGPFAIPRASLLPGTNVLAVEVHQDDGSSSDTVFAATLDAVLPPSDARTTNTFGLLDHLRITEMLFNGSAGETTEFVELINTGDAALDLTGVRFTRGIDFTFGAVMLAPGERIVLAQDVATFEALYGTGINVVGNYGGSLANGGEEIKLTLPTPLTGAIEQFIYDDGWYPLSDGGGYSLVVRDVGSSASLDNPASWRASYFLGGTPGTGDGGQIVVNEVLANSGAPGGDWVEVHNTTNRELDIGGWLLTDDLATPQKYAIPAGTIVPAGDYRVFTEETGFGSGDAADPFSLAAPGGEVHLIGVDAIGNLTGYVDTLAFGASEAGVTIGRYTRSDGNVDVVRLASATQGTANALPAIGPILVSEVMYRPAAGGDEFIELYNPTAATVSLYDELGGTPAAWQLAGAVDFEFPAGAAIAAGERVLIVGIDPAAYRTAHQIPAGVAIFGPYTGDLADGGDNLQLLAPDAVDPTLLLLVDRVAYDNAAPWPRLADGRGSALIRNGETSYGNEAASWLASNLGGTPGTANREVDRTPPTAPSDLAATVIDATQNDLTWTAASDGESGIALYRIFRNGAVIGTSTTTDFSDQEAVAGQTYVYEVAAVNGDSLVGPRSVSATVSTLGITVAGNLDDSRVVVIFSETVTAASAEIVGSYAIGGLTVSSATLAADGRTVTLVTSAVTGGRNYTLTVNGIVGTAGSVLPSGVSTSFRGGSAGFTVRDVQSASANSPSNLTQAEELLALPPNSSQIVSETTVILPAIDLRDPDTGLGGRFPLNQPFPNGVAGVNDDRFAVHVTGTLFIPLNLAGTWTFGTRNDDGLRLRIGGEDVIVDPSGHGPADRFGTVDLEVGFHTVEINYWDGTQGSLLEFFAAPGSFTDFDATSAWRLVGDTANGGLSVTTLPLPTAEVEWQRVGPLGSGIFEFSSSGSVSGPGSFTEFDVQLLAGQTLSVAIAPASASALPVFLINQDGLPVVAAIGQMPGESVALNDFVVSSTGLYTIQVQATAATSFTLHAALNASIERETSPSFVQQVARHVIDFSSQFATDSWSAAQALGAPDTFQYGDLPTAWAPEPINGTMEFITVGYDVPVYATGAVIVETNGNGFVRRVETLDVDGVYHVVWEDVDPSQPGAPANFQVAFEQTTYLVTGLRVTIDTDHDMQAWEEIDAIILEGVQAALSNDIIATATPMALSSMALPNGAERLAVAGVTDDGAFDYYRVEATAGDVLSVALSTEGRPDLDLAIVDGTGQPLALGIDRPLDTNLSIHTYVVPASGPVYVRVGGDADVAYRLVAVRGGEFAVEPNNDLSTAIDITTSGVGMGYVGEGASGSGEPGQTGSVNFTQFVTDGEGFNWDISGDGSINDGTNDAYDGGMRNQGFSSFSNGLLENNDREFVIGPQGDFGGVETTRKVYISDSEGFARFLEIITNTSGAPVVHTVQIDTNLGSDGTPGELVTTSSGDAVFTIDDLWVLTDDTDGSNDPTILHIVAGAGGDGPSSVNATGSGTVRYEYTLTLQPGETQIVMHFGAQSQNRAIALAKADDLANLERGALSGMTAEELAQIVNFRPADAVDAFSVWASAGDTLSIATQTPAIGFDPYAISPEGPTGTNSLDPAVELLDADGNVLASDDNSGADGRNALVNYTVATAGLYQIRVASKTGSGEYTLSVEGATGSVQQTAVVATTPVDGAAFRPESFPQTITVELSAGIAPLSVAADDLTVNGIAAESVVQIDGDTLVFTLPASADTGEGTYDVSLAAGSLDDLAGRGNSAYSGTFHVDATAARLMATTFNGMSFPVDARFEGNALSATFRFDEPVFPTAEFSAFQLVETNRNQSFFPFAVQYSDDNRTLSVVWGGLREGQYTLRLFDGGLLDVVGNRLDGEAVGTNPDGTTTGDGVPGGTYTLNFVVDVERSEIDTLWQRTGGLGTLALQADAVGHVTFAGDTDAFAMRLDAGESVDAVVRPIRPGVLSMRLVDSDGNELAASSAGAAGGAVHLGGFRVSEAGEYRLEVSGDTADQDYVVTLSRNASIESLGAAGAQSLHSASSTVAGQRWSVLGNSTPRAVGDYRQTQTASGNVAFPNESDLTFTRAGMPRGDAVLNIEAMVYLEGTSAFLTLYAEGHNLGDVFVDDGNGFEVSNTTLTVPRSIVEELAADGVIELRVVPSQNVFNVFGDSYVEIEFTYASSSVVWGVRPAEGDIVVIDPSSGEVVRSFAAPDALAPEHSNIGLTTADNGSTLLYINSDVDPNLVYRLNPTTGAVLSTSTVTGAGYDGLGFDGNLATSTVYSADMSTNPGWTLTGQWAYGQPTGSGGFSPDPTSGFTGPNVIGYNLNGDYPDNVSNTFYATTPAIDARGVTGTTLSFYRWLGIESCCDDVNIQVSNNGTNWTTIWENSSGDIIDTGWVLQTFDISAVADNQANVRVRWGLGPTDGSVTYAGWNIDDVLVTGQTAADPKLFFSQRDDQLVRQEGFNGSTTADWGTGAPRGGLAGDDNGRLFAMFDDGLIHEIDPDSDTDAFIGIPITPPATDIEGLAFDGAFLYASTASGVLYTIDATTGDVVAQIDVPRGGLYGLASGATLALTVPSALVPQGSVWKYFDQGQDLGTAWRARTFDDAAWSSGPARLGYGGDGEVTTVRFGGNVNNKFPTTYFRHHFQVADPAQIESLFLELIRDDGAAVYLNGNLIVLDNLPSNPAYGTFAFGSIGGNGEQQWNPFDVNPSLLVAGDNVLAVEIHQAAPDSSDLGFDLRITATPRPPLVADIDVYALDLTGHVGGTLDITLDGVFGNSLSSAKLELLGPGGGSVLATGQVAGVDPEGLSYDVGILSFVVPEDGVYTIRVTSLVESRYVLSVTENAVFDSEPNNSSGDGLRSLDALRVATGFVFDAEDPLDLYALTLTAGERVRLVTERLLPQTPLFGMGLDPRIDVYTSTGELLVSRSDSVQFGLDPVVDFVAPADGVYHIGVGTDSGIGEYRLTVSSLPAADVHVADVVVGGSNWNAETATNVAAAGLGAAVNSVFASTDAVPVVLPWIGLDRVAITFTADVSVAAGDLRIYGVNGASYAATDFAYDAATFTASWTLGDAIADDNLLLILSDDVTGGGERLDGNGDSLPGGAFVRRFRVLVGDVNGDGRTNVLDAVDVRNHFAVDTNDVAYLARADLDGSGDVGMDDLAMVAGRMFRASASSEPALMPLAGDFNRDGIVGVRDLIYLRNRLDLQGATTLDGDMTGDGFVDLRDVAMLVASMGQTAAAPPGALVARAATALRPTSGVQARRLQANVADRALDGLNGSLTARTTRRARMAASADASLRVDRGEDGLRVRAMRRTSDSASDTAAAARDVALSAIIDPR